MVHSSSEDLRKYYQLDGEGEGDNILYTADFTCVQIFRVAYGIAFCVGQRIVP